MSTYSLASYAGMLSCSTRLPAHLQALQQAVRPGSVVLDLGAGFGFFALFACQLGAARVYAIEPAESLDFLPELARINGFADRIVAHRELSTRVTLPERVDVIVADLRGTLPMLSGSLGTLIDARERLLAPGGTLIPWRDRLMVAPVDDRPVWASGAEPWARASRGFEVLGLKFDPVRERMAHTALTQTLDPHSFVAEPQSWAEIDYHTNLATDVEGKVEFCLSETGMVHGLALWFEAELMAGIRYSTAPGQLPTAYGTLFLPLLRPLSVQAGDRLEVSLASNDVGGEYQLRWRTVLKREGKALAAFDQGDFFAASLSLEQLKQRLPSHVPALKPEAQVARLVLEGAEARRPLGEIARSLLEAFPQRFESLAKAMEHASKTLERLNG